MAYSEIEILVPSEAEEGGTVAYQVNITNTRPVTQQYQVEIWAPDTNTLVRRQQLWLTAGSTWPYTNQFVMPNQDAIVFVWVEFWNGTAYEYDNALAKDIILIIPLPDPQFSDLAVTYSKL